MPVSAPPPSWANLRNKPTTVAGFGISDMASQSVASATNATNVTNVTTAQVLAANAGASFGAVGTYYESWTGYTAGAVGGTIAGSTLTKVNGTVQSAGLSGTWRNMGPREDVGSASLFLRVA